MQHEWGRKLILTNPCNKPNNTRTLEQLRRAFEEVPVLPQERNLMEECTVELPLNTTCKPSTCIALILNVPSAHAYFIDLQLEPKIFFLAIIHEFSCSLSLSLSLSFPLSNDPLSESPAILVISRRSMTTRFRIPSSIWLSRTLCPWLVHLTDRISRLNASLSNGRTYEPLASLLLASVDRRVECSSLCAHGVFNARRGKESRVRRSWSSTALRQTEIKLALDTAAVSRE